eukprot:1185831-Prorocentrum_minimum.AAC.4
MTGKLRDKLARNVKGTGARCSAVFLKAAKDCLLTPPKAVKAAWRMELPAVSTTMSNARLSHVALLSGEEDLARSLRSLTASPTPLLATNISTHMGPV